MAKEGEKKTFNVITVEYSVCKEQAFHIDDTEVNQAIKQYNEGTLADVDIAEILGVSVDDCDVQITTEERVFIDGVWRCSYDI